MFEFLIRTGRRKASAISGGAVDWRRRAWRLLQEAPFQAANAEKLLVNSVQMALLTLFVTLLAGLIGFCVTLYLKESWLDGISRDQFKALRNMIGSLLAVCLAFLLVTAKNNFDKKVELVRTQASQVILLHRVLDIFGDEAGEARTKIIRTLQGQIDLLQVARHNYIDQKEAFKKAKIDSFRGAVLAIEAKDPNKSLGKVGRS